MKVKVNKPDIENSKKELAKSKEMIKKFKIYIDEGLKVNPESLRKRFTI